MTKNLQSKREEQIGSVYMHLRLFLPRKIVVVGSRKGRVKLTIVVVSSAVKGKGYF